MIKKRQCKVNNLYIPARMVKDKNNLLRKKKIHLQKRYTANVLHAHDWPFKR